VHFVIFSIPFDQDALNLEFARKHQNLIECMIHHSTFAQFQYPHKLLGVYPGHKHFGSPEACDICFG
jgi:hypothetical protein